MKKMNLACGADIKKGYLNVDFVKQPGVDKIVNLEKFPWPFKDNEFDEIYTSHFLEHVNDFEKTLLEIRRVTKNGGKLIVRVPHFSCGVSYRDPTHKTLFSYFSFDNYIRGGKTYKKFNEFKCIRIIKRKLNFTRLAFTSLNYIFNPLININPSIYERFFCWMLPCSEALFELEIVK